MRGNKRQKLAVRGSQTRSTRATAKSIVSDKGASTPRTNSDDGSSYSGSESDFDAGLKPPPTASSTKKRKVTPQPRSKASGYNKTLEQLFETGGNSAKREATCIPPTRQHTIWYHQPLLLDSKCGSPGRKALLTWFDSVSESRSMPWRKAWVNPRDISDPTVLRQTLEKRAYQVWISEIMLQQTRVAVVIDYWNRWMAKWPTIQDLAAANSEDVLAAWSGLGYYSRATRIHEAAKLAVEDAELKGLLPSTAKELEAKMPGVGRYTAGAISSIVFGRAAPMVDGNVLRVLSRQLGIHGNIKTSKSVIDTIWAAADAIVRTTAALDGDAGDASSLDDPEPSDRPGRWGQALMELGSTVCTPKPNCDLCPITSTCRVYAEGQASSEKAKGAKAAAAAAVDIEDLCTLCESFEGNLDDDSDEGVATGKDAKKKKPAGTSKTSAKQPTLAAFAFTRSSSKESSKPPKDTPSSSSEKPSKASIEAISNYARRFPVKVVKKAVREEETIVCAIRRASDGKYMIQQRPLKGLLAGLWELPSQTVEPRASGDDDDDDARDTVSVKRREQLARSFVAKLVLGDDAPSGGRQRDIRRGAGKKRQHRDGESEAICYGGELGSVPWLFSHIKLTMHVHSFTIEDAGSEGSAAGDRDEDDGGDDGDNSYADAAAAASTKTGEGGGGGSFAAPDYEAIKQRIDTPSRWVAFSAIDAESMGTGMRKCWALVKDSLAAAG